MTTARQTAQNYAYAGMQSGRTNSTILRGPIKNNAPKTENLSNLKYVQTQNSTSHQPQKSKTITVDEALEKASSQKDISTMNVNELNELEQNHMLTAQEKDDLQKQQEKLGLNTNKTNEKPDAGKLKKDGDPDDEIIDEEKFDIQQGDFIDFLMKEVVLASAAWVGKKVSGQVNLALYKASSYTYHQLSEVVGDGWDFVKEQSKDAYKNLKNIKDNHGKHLIDYHYIKNAPEEYQKLYNQHNQDIKYAHIKIDDAESVSRLCMEAVSHDELNVKEIKGKTYWFDSKTKKGIPLDDEYVRTILTRAQQIHKNIEQLGLTTEQKEQAYQTIAENMSAVLMNGFAVRAQAEIFAANMATAQMVKDSANEDAPKKPREEYIANYKKDFFIMMKKLNNNESLGNINSIDDLVSASDKARSLACNNQKNGHPEADNQYLTGINNLTSPQERQQDLETIYSAALGSEHLSNLNDMYKKIDEDVKNLKKEQERIYLRREHINRTRANTSNPHESPKPPQTPVIEKGRGKR